jgi:hypothetical protein
MAISPVISRWSYNRVGIMLFKATLNNISVISWWSVLLVEKITDLLQVIDKIYNRVTSQEEQFSSNLLPQFILNLTSRGIDFGRSGLTTEGLLYAGIFVIICFTFFIFFKFKYYILFILMMY